MADDGLPPELELPVRRDLAARRMDRDVKILQMSEEELISAWEACVRNLMNATVTLEEEITKGCSANVGRVRGFVANLGGELSSERRRIISRGHGTTSPS